MFVAKWYTRASRVRIVIAKFDGRWKLPGGPYPIPELVAAVAGILATLFALPKFGNPLLTAGVGLATTAFGVAMMRRMPYSPVRFGTRLLRIYRLYTGPISLTAGEQRYAVSPVSAVRPLIQVLDPGQHQASAQRHRTPRPAAPLPARQGTAAPADMFDVPQSTAAALFG